MVKPIEGVYFKQRNMNHCCDRIVVYFQNKWFVKDTRGFAYKCLALCSGLLSLLCIVVQCLYLFGVLDPNTANPHS